MLKTELLQALTLCETDVEGALSRFYGDEDNYLSLLYIFLEEPTMAQLSSAIEEKRWDDAFIAAHALKGLAGNMGFVPLFHAIGELVVLIRKGKSNEIDAAYEQIKFCYEQVIEAIRKIDRG